MEEEYLNSVIVGFDDRSLLLFPVFALLQFPLSSYPSLSMSNPDEQMGGEEKKGHASLLHCNNTVNQSPPPTLTSCASHHALFFLVNISACSTSVFRPFTLCPLSSTDQICTANPHDVVGQSIDRSDHLSVLVFITTQQLLPRLP